MEQKLDKIFKAYDVRGIYGSELTEDIVEKTANATVKFLGAKKMLIAMDARDSSPSLKEAAINGIKKSGADIIDIGITTTPMFYWAVNKEDADGGIMITASHNPPEYNGLKISKKYAQMIGENSGLLDIKKMVLSEDIQTSENEGDLENKELLEEYVSFLSNGLENINLKIAADFSCGASSIVLEKVAEKIGVGIVSLCKMKDPLIHEGNPLKDENVTHFVELIKNEKPDFGVAYDTDADRAFFFNSNGERIDSSQTAALIAENYLNESPGSKFIGSINIGKSYKEAVEENKGEYIKSRVGHVFIKQAMREHDAVFGAESSGHFYFKDFFYADSALFATIQIIKMIKNSGKTIDELAKKYSKHFRSGETNFKVEDKEKAMQKIKELFLEGKVDELDGVTIEMSDFWLNARPSNTEPLLRLNIEAESPEKLKEILEKVEQIIK